MVYHTIIGIFLVSLLACEVLALVIWFVFGENYAVHLAIVAVVAVVITLVSRGNRETP